ncbi:MULTISPECIES: M50 family metallopeptidase [Clostridium]|uniref:Stage IV sporulation protein FB n=1 Tax=Clostridium ragsdalei P11 TaxID=1353534 RepID=A0A1A6APK6_9CLOT|nr:MULTISPECIES: M50 family metallopeptidase [Clostridium]OBR91992.1 stage IV sporulation protein FB [Clostridium ragsdalei P11]QXE19958.1 metalloprotease [Clostridium sp. 001]
MIKISKYFIPYVIFLIFIGYKGKLIYTFIIVFFHEMVHYLVARYYKFSGFDIEFIAIGTVIKLKDLDEAFPREDLIISISGPAANLIFSAVFYFAYKNFYLSIFYMLFSINLAIGLFNLIPAFPLDGGRILRSILNLKMTYRKANRIMIITSIFIGIALMFMYILLFLNGYSNFSIGIIGIFIVTTSLRENERISYIIMGDIIRKRYKFIKRGYIENRTLSIHYRQDLLTAMGLFDKNKYNTFMVLDDEMNLMDTIYEEEIIEGLKLYGNITLEKFIEILNDK